MKKWVVASFAVLPFIVAVSPSDPQATPTPAECPALPGTLGPIAGLQTGQVVESNDDATLRFSSEVRACGEWSNEVSGGLCYDRWSFSIDLPREALVLGDHYLSQLGASFGDLVVTTSPASGSGCGRHECSTSVRGNGSTLITSPVAKLVIESVNDACITGTLVGIGDPFRADAPNFNGAFFAVRCAP